MIHGISETEIMTVEKAVEVAISLKHVLWLLGEKEYADEIIAIDVLIKHAEDKKKEYKAPSRIYSCGYCNCNYDYITLVDNCCSNCGAKFAAGVE